MEIEQEFEQNTDFVDQLETNLEDYENLVGKNYTLGGIPIVNKGGIKKRKTCFTCLSKGSMQNMVAIMGSVHRLLA